MRLAMHKGHTKGQAADLMLLLASMLNLCESPVRCGDAVLARNLLHTPQVCPALLSANPFKPSLL